MAFHVGSAIALVLCAGQVSGVHGSGPFFESDADPFLGRVVATRACVQAEIEAALSNFSGADEEVHDRLAEVQEQMRPTYDVLPHNEYGRLGSTGVRYLLHRHFLQYRAWLVSGLAPDGEAWNASFPLEILEGGAPEEVRIIVADHLKGRGLSLREVAVLATMLENQVREDAEERLLPIWQAHGLDRHDVANLERMRSIVNTHALTYFLPDWAQIGEMTQEHILRATLDAERQFSKWPMVKEFMWRTLDEVRGAEEGLDLSMAKRAVVRAIERFGQFQESDCVQLKRWLVDLESERPGRVDLRAFYREAVEGRHWEFGESVAYLRELGVLDETDPAAPSVIIPNYITSPSNFIATSPRFAVACLDECEDLLGAVERRVGAPMADVDQIAAIVSQLPSSSQSAWSAMPSSLLEQLEEVARFHGGKVPLHGRLFALWMHHVYPRDCPYPHLAGATRPSLVEDFQGRTGLKAAATMDVMREVVERSSGGGARRGAPLPWDLNEELVEVPARRRTVVMNAKLLGGVFCVAFLAAVSVVGCVRRAHLAHDVYGQAIDRLSQSDRVFV